MGNNQSQEVQKVVVVSPATVQVTEKNPDKVVVTVSEPAVVAQNQYSFRSFVECATESLLQVGPWIYRQKQDLANSQLCSTWNDAKSYLKTEVQAPLCNLYTAIPEKFTEAKFELISPYTYNQRFTVLNILCALTAISTITSTSKVDPFSRILRTTRNAGFMYLLGGLLVAPEIYNPFIRSY